MLKVGGTVEDYEAKANSVKASLRQELQCFLPACVLTVTVKAGSVILTVVATDASGGASQVELAAVALRAKALDVMSLVLGVTIEELPATPSVIEVQVQVTRLAPSPLPPSPPPAPPPSSPTTMEVKADSQVLWAVLPLSVLLIAAAVLLVLCYRRQSRLSRDRANLRISRDRANLDLQMLSHQVQIRVQTHQADDSASLPPDSLPAKSLSRVPAASLPPGPPSGSAWDPSLSEVGAPFHSVPQLLGEFDDPALDLNWVLEAGLLDEIAGVEPSGVATATAPTLSALDVRSELDRAELVDLAELAKLAGLASGLEDLGDEEAVEQGMAQVMMNMEMQMQDLPNQEVAASSGRFPPPGPLPQAIEIDVARTSTLTLREKFDTLVMVNYTPRSPTELPMAQWASCN